MHRTNRVPRAPLWGLLLLGLLFGGKAYTVWGQPAPAPAPAAEKEEPKDAAKPGPIFVPVGGAVRLQMTKKLPNGQPPLIQTVVNDKENIVRINTVGGIGTETGDPSTIILTGLQPGTAHLKLTSKSDLSTKPPYLSTTEDFEIVVELDIEILKRLLKQAVPTAAVTPIPGAGNTIILAGTVAHSEDVDTVLGIARSVTAGGAGPAQIINALRVGGVMQVQLDVVVALVSRDEMRKMAVDLYDAGQHHDFTTSPAGAFSLPANNTGLQGSIPPSPTQGFTIQNTFANPNNSQLSTFLDIFNTRQAFFAFLQALRINELAKILAEPHIVTLSGKTANFVSGGEQAVPSISGFGGVAGVTFVPFGTTVQFLPIVLGNGKIYMEVQPEVSQLDPSAGATIGAGFIDGRRVQRIRTAVTMEDGQTLAIGGLIQNTVAATITKIPIIGDMPFIGVFFSSKNYEDIETELLILVTPHLVDPMDCCQVPKYLPGQETRKPDDFELYLENILEAPRGSREVNHGSKYVPAWKNGPTAKQYPCVSTAGGPPLGCPGCPDSMAPGVGVPIPHDVLLQPGPVPPMMGNVHVQEGTVIMQDVQPASGTMEVPPPVGAAGTAPPRPTTEQPANLPPVTSVPLNAGGQ